MKAKTSSRVLGTVIALSLMTSAVSAREAVVLKPSSRLTPESLNEFLAAGIQIGSHLGDGQYQASIEDGSLAQTVQRLGNVDRDAVLEPMPASIKLRPLLRGAPGVPSEIIDSNSLVAVTVVPASGQDPDSFTHLLRQLDPNAQRNLKVGGWSMTVHKNQINDLAAKPQVASVRRAPLSPTLR